MTGTHLTARLLRIHEVADLLALSRSKTYQLVASGELPSVTIGRSRRVTAAALEQYLEALERPCAAERSPDPRRDLFPVREPFPDPTRGSFPSPVPVGDGHHRQPAPLFVR